MAQVKKFVRLTAEHPLVEELASGKHLWWRRLVEISRTDRDISIQVRGTYLNVYCKMGNLLKIVSAQSWPFLTSLAADVWVESAHEY